jgi:amidase
MVFTQMSAQALSQAIHRRTLSCREVMQACLAQVALHNPAHLAIVSLQDADHLLRQADERDAMLARGQSMGWMHGLPIAIKDLAATAGIPTTLGSPLMRDHVPTEDAAMVARIRRAGAILIGKTNVPEFGLGSHSFNEVFGTTANAYDTRLSAGGSSGGAAVALALRMLPVADGSDFMGSLRNPAGWNNLFGMRPSQGRVPGVPAQDVYVSQMPTDGPMGRHVADLALLLSTQAGPDPRAPLSLSADPSVFANDLYLDVSGQRVGWLGDLDGYLPTEVGVLDACQAGLGRLQQIGCVAQGAGGGPHRPLRSNPAAPILGQARGPVGIRPGPGHQRQPVHAGQHRAQRVLPGHAQTL